MDSSNSITSRFSRSWKIAKDTFKVMWQDKEILIFPILSSVFSIILLVLFLFPLILTGNLQYRGIYLYLSIFFIYFIITFLAVFFNAGIVYIAKTRFSGGNATLSDGLKAGFRHMPQLISWSLLSATVGLLLNLLSSPARKNNNITGLIQKAVISLLGLAWAIVSVFVVPAIVLKGHGPIKALRSSVEAVKKTWGESLIRYYGLGLLKGIFSIVGFILFLVPGVLLITSGSLNFGIVLIIIFAFYFMLVSIIFSSANTVFNTALFIYADTGKVPSGYSKEELQHAFVADDGSKLK